MLGSGTTSAAPRLDLSQGCCSLLPFLTQVPQASPAILTYQLSSNTKKTQNGILRLPSHSRLHSQLSSSGTTFCYPSHSLPSFCPSEEPQPAHMAVERGSRMFSFLT